jgi:hypothetical protein
MRHTMKSLLFVSLVATFISVDAKAQDATAIGAWSNSSIGMWQGIVCPAGSVKTVVAVGSGTQFTCVNSIDNADRSQTSGLADVASVANSLDAGASISPSQITGMANCGPGWALSYVNGAMICVNSISSATTADMATTASTATTAQNLSNPSTFLCPSHMLGNMPQKYEWAGPLGMNGYILLTGDLNNPEKNMYTGICRIKYTTTQLEAAELSRYTQYVDQFGNWTTMTREVIGYNDSYWGNGSN